MLQSPAGRVRATYKVSMNSEPFRYHLCREIGVARAHAKETDQNPDDKCARLILDCSGERCWGDHHISEDRCRETQYLSRGGCRWTGPETVHDWCCAALADRTLRAEAFAAQPTQSTAWESGAEPEIVITYWGVKLSWKIHGNHKPSRGSHRMHIQIFDQFWIVLRSNL